ncbi:MAG: hypothetical protein AB7N54_13740 [Alphaproteobacteria bacterium]
MSRNTIAYPHLADVLHDAHSEQAKVFGAVFGALGRQLARPFHRRHAGLPAAPVCAA